MKLVNIGFIVLLYFTLMLSLSSAYYFPSVRTASENAVDTAVDFFEPILRALFGGADWSGTYLFEKLLLFILLVSIVYLASGKIPSFEDKKNIRWIIAIVIPLIGVRFIEFEWMEAIISEYQLLAIVITAILPFAIYFFFLNAIFPGDGNAIVRRFGWALFGLVYLGLWSTYGSEETSVIFFWTMIVSFSFIFLDNYMARLLHIRELNKADRGRAAQFIADIDRQIRYLHESTLSSHDKKERLKELEDQRKYWQKRL